MNDCNILFRGFHPIEKGTTLITLNGELINGEWVYWNLFGYECNSAGIIMHDRYGLKEMIYPSMVREETIGQRVTKDRNGTSVFEYDNIKDKNGVRYIVELIDMRWQAVVEYPDSVHCMDLCYLEDIENIGNKFEVTK